MQEDVTTFATVASVTVTPNVGLLAWDGGDYIYACDTRESAVVGSNRVARIHRTTRALTYVTLAGSSGASRVGSYGICCDVVAV